MFTSVIKRLSDITDTSLQIINQCFKKTVAPTSQYSVFFTPLLYALANLLSLLHAAMAEENCAMGWTLLGKFLSSVTMWEGKAARFAHSFTQTHTDTIHKLTLTNIYHKLTYKSIQEAQLLLTNCAMPVWKVAEVLQDFLPEYVDKKLSRDYNVIRYLSIFNSFRVIRCLSQCVSPKISFLAHFCFSRGCPWGNHAKCCIDGKRIRCLQIVSLHVPI